MSSDLFYLDIPFGFNTDLYYDVPLSLIELQKVFGAIKRVNSCPAYAVLVKHSYVTCFPLLTFRAEQLHMVQQASNELAPKENISIKNLIWIKVHKMKKKQIEQSQLFDSAHEYLTLFLIGKYLDEIHPNFIAPGKKFYVNDSMKSYQVLSYQQIQTLTKKTKDITNDKSVANIYQHQPEALKIYLDLLVPPNGVCVELFAGTAPLARAALAHGSSCISIDKFQTQIKTAYDLTSKFVKALEKEKEKSVSDDVNMVEKQNESKEQSENDDNLETQQNTQVACGVCMEKFTNEENLVICECCGLKVHEATCFYKKAFDASTYSFCRNCSLCAFCGIKDKRSNLKICTKCKNEYCNDHSKTGKRENPNSWICGNCAK